MLVTSALANKILLQLSNEKDIYLEREKDSSFYTIEQGEVDPYIPEFDFDGNCKAIAEIDKKVAIIKHAINVANVNAKIEVLGNTYCVDEILVQMAQLSNRMNFYNKLRKALPKKKLEQKSYNPYNSNTIKYEYLYVNYDIKETQRKYKEAQEKVYAMQIALDTFNHTYEFDIDVDISSSSNED